jgi:membrane protein DedA with SNARE-associated domain
MELSQSIAAYGYWGIALVVGLESMGIPLPGETILVAAAIAAGAANEMAIELVILAAAGGAIIGDSIGYWIGRKLGFPLLLRYGHRVGLGEPMLKLGQYLFLRHGGKVVFIGRFVAVLRITAGLLAGANHMAWGRFLLFNASGGLVWAALFGLGAYAFGSSVRAASRPLAIVLVAVTAVALVAGFHFVRRHEKRLLAEAERAIPGPFGRAADASDGAPTMRP